MWYFTKCYLKIHLNHNGVQWTWRHLSCVQHHFYKWALPELSRKRLSERKWCKNIPNAPWKVGENFKPMTAQNKEASIALSPLLSWSGCVYMSSEDSRRSTISLMLPNDPSGKQIFHRLEWKYIILDYKGLPEMITTFPSLCHWLIKTKLIN